MCKGWRRRLRYARAPEIARGGEALSQKADVLVQEPAEPESVEVTGAELDAVALEAQLLLGEDARALLSVSSSRSRRLRRYEVVAGPVTADAGDADVDACAARSFL